MTGSVTSMKKVFSYLKSEIGVLIVCIGLLFIQAMTDLSLPNYMSDIVNVGIQQGGIEETAPIAISEDGFELVTTFMNEGSRAEFSELYSFVEAGDKSYTDSYPFAKENNIYVLKDAEVYERAGELYSKAIYAFVTFMSDMQTENTQQQTTSAESTADASELYAVLPMLRQLPNGALDEYISLSLDVDSTISAQYGSAFIKMFYNELSADVDSMQTRYIAKTGVKMLLITIVGVFSAIMVSLFSSKIGARLAKNLRRDVFEKVESFSSAEFDKFSTASLITRTTNDITQVQMLIVMGLRMVCYAPIMGVGGVIMALDKSASLSWIIACAVIVLLGLMLVIFAIALPKFKAIQKLIDRLNLVTRENLSGMMVIRAFGNQKYEEERFDNANKTLTDTNLFVNRVMAFMMPAMMFIMNIVSVGIIWFGAKQIEMATIQVGDMLAFMQYGMQIIGAFLMIAMMFIFVPRAAVSANRIAEVLNTEISVTDNESLPVHFERRPRGIITFDKVNFRYPNAKSDVLHNISFTAKPGETTAFIGSTGSGKSTLINLIPRFYDVTHGEILLDGVNIKDIPQHELREYIGFVPQKAVLFTGDIESNIRYGREDATEEDIKLASEIAQATEFISSTEEGYQTPIAQGGSNVSGGQKQRLSIARALAKQAPVYIFDDSFSALDFKTDFALRKALAEHTNGATVLIVAQRVSTIMNANQIVVLDDGKIAGVGTHKQLLENCEVYREIAQSQLSEEELKNE